MKVIKGKKDSQEDFRNQLAKNLEGLKLKDLDTVECEKCKNPTFIQVHLLRKISPVLSPNGKSGFLPLPVFQCAGCGYINEELMPRTEDGQ
jgi:hypothetical protein